MTTPASLISGFRPVVGYATTTSVKIGLFSLKGGDVSFQGLQDVSVSAWTDLGGDNPARPTEHVISAAVATITGLKPNTRYSGVIVCDGISRNISFKTQPIGGESYSFIHYHCDRTNTRFAPGRSNWQEMKKLAEKNDHLFTAVIDDVNYPYAIEFTDPVTGMGTTGSCSETGLEWDYALAWSYWAGLVFSDIRSYGCEERLWLHANSAHWFQLGDNDIAPNHARQVSRQRRDEELLTFPAFWSTATKCWEHFCANYGCPPKGLENGSPSSQDDYLWGTVIGSARFISPDVATYMQPFDDPGTGYVCGTTQINDIKTYLNNNENFKIFFNPIKIGGSNNEPWDRQDWEAEWHALIGGGSGLLDNPNTDGTNGVMIFMAGDTHNARVVKYTANGVDGLGGAALSSGSLWEFCSGTPNGSGSHYSMFGLTYSEGGEIRTEKYGYRGGTSQDFRDTICMSCSVVRVNTDSLIVEAVDLYNGGLIGGPWKFETGSNNPTSPTRKIGF